MTDKEELENSSISADGIISVEDHNLMKSEEKNNKKIRELSKYYIDYFNVAMAVIIALSVFSFIIFHKNRNMIALTGNLYKPGGIITLGRWPAGSSAQPIEWKILEKNDDGTAILLSRYVIDRQKYHINHTGITWENSTLRKWLNTEFYNAAFDENEKKNIIDISLKNSDNNMVFTAEHLNNWKRNGKYKKGDEKYIGNKYHTPGGNDTIDKVWLLSLDEIKQYKILSTENSKTVKPIWYIAKKYNLSAASNIWWWLRSPGDVEWAAAHINHNGFINDLGHDVDTKDGGGVRPAIKIRIY